MKKLLGIVVLGLMWCNLSFADEKDFENAAMKFTEVKNAKFVTDSTFVIDVIDLSGMDWNAMAKIMCGGKKRYGLDSKAFSIIVFSPNFTKIGEAHCEKYGFTNKF